MMTTEEYNDKPTGSDDGRITQMTDLIPRDAAIEEAFMDAVWAALKADATDLGKQRRILTAVRAIDPASIREAALREAAHIGYVTCAETRHVTLGNAVSEAILALIGEKK